MDRMAIAKRLVALRGQTGKEETARKYGVSRSALNMYERGERVPRDEIKMRIAECYDMPVQDIFFC